MNSSSATSAPERYSAEELQEFKSLINAKLAKAEETLASEQDSLMRLSSHNTDDTYLGHAGLEEGNMVLEREDLTRSVVRLEKYILDLKAALIRIRMGDYGVCRTTGRLIPKERLRVVPHATLTVEAKNMRKEPVAEPVRVRPDDAGTEE